MRIPIWSAYTQWLHTMYPAGKVENLPESNADGSTRIPGVYIAGDLNGVPLLKFSTNSGAVVVDRIKESAPFKSAGKGGGGATDVAIIGAGVAGISAALRAKKLGLSFRVLETSKAFSTIVNFPKGKPIYTYPKDFDPDTELETTGDVKESLLEELRAQVIEAGIEIEEGASINHIERNGKHLKLIVEEGEPILARAVVIAIGRTGNYRTLDIPGEELEKVSNRLYDPHDLAGKRVLVVGGGDSALEAAIAVAEAGGEVTLSYRREEFSRPKPDNLEKIESLKGDEAAAGKINIKLNTIPTAITQSDVTIKDRASSDDTQIENDVVLTMIGREPPLEFFRKSRLPIANQWTVLRVLAFASFLLFCTWMYAWKGGGDVQDFWYAKGWFPYNLPELFSNWGAAWENRETLLGTIATSMQSPSFYYTLGYSTCVVCFGIARIRRRKTPYIRAQTLTLMAIQVVPLFLLPEIILPWLGANGWFDHGVLRSVADALFPGVGADREFWRAYGLILAWPLFIYNFFTAEPMVWWLIIGFVQTFVLIPAMVFFWGKGAYCGWICSCGALAETMGDTHRHKMPHGPFWSRLNMLGQVILIVAFLGMGMRIWGWVDTDSWAAKWFDWAFHGTPQKTELVLRDAHPVARENQHWTSTTGVDGEKAWTLDNVTDEDGIVLADDHYGFMADWTVIAGTPDWEADVRRIYDGDEVASLEAVDKHGNTIEGAAVPLDASGEVKSRSAAANYVSYKWIVDTLMAGIIGVGFYFWFSGRVWCRFACPLAALMHIYAKFSRFRIIPDKKKCISCNVCTSVCHQGIDVMSFANKGVPMEDPECVRCSACVQSCPTGVLQFGQVDRDNKPIKYDKLGASPVLMAEED